VNRLSRGSAQAGLADLAGLAGLAVSRTDVPRSKPDEAREPDEAPGLTD